MPTTEILVCPLKAGSNIGDESNEAAKVLKEVGERLKSTDGVHSIQFGMQIENPDVFQLLVSKSFQWLDNTTSLCCEFTYMAWTSARLLNITLPHAPPPLHDSDSGVGGCFNLSLGLHHDPRIKQAFILTRLLTRLGQH